VKSNPEDKGEIGPSRVQMMLAHTSGMMPKPTKTRTDSSSFTTPTEYEEWKLDWILQKKEARFRT
jgi:hypothetical protein